MHPDRFTYLEHVVVVPVTAAELGVDPDDAAMRFDVPNERLIFSTLFA